MKELPIRELIELLSSFYEEVYTEATKGYKLKLIADYRRVEKETNDQIEKFGSVEKWYLSGQGRLMEI